MVVEVLLVVKCQSRVLLCSQPFWVRTTTTTTTSRSCRCPRWKRHDRARGYEVKFVGVAGVLQELHGDFEGGNEPF